MMLFISLCIALRKVVLNKKYLCKKRKRKNFSRTMPMLLKYTHYMKKKNIINNTGRVFFCNSYNNF